MKREEVLVNLQKVQKAINTIKNKSAHNYATTNKFLAGIGKIEEIDNYRDLVKAHMHINKETLEFEKSAEVLGLTTDDIKDSGSKVMGIASEKWVKDIQARVAELKDKQMMAQLLVAEKKLTAHLSEDDKFTIEMGSVADVLSLI